MVQLIAILLIIGVLISFKYILCYGSTLKIEIIVKDIVEFKYILCYGSTMLNGRLEN